jgi:hypothetical protein
MNHRSPNLRVVDAHFHHFLGHISQALQRAGGHPAANFRISDLAVLSQHSYWTYLSRFGRCIRQLGWSFLRELVPADWPWGPAVRFYAQCPQVCMYQGTFAKKKAGPRSWVPLCGARKGCLARAIGRANEGLAGMAELRPLFPGGGQEEEKNTSWLSEED